MQHCSTSLALARWTPLVLQRWGPPATACPRHLQDELPSLPKVGTSSYSSSLALAGRTPLVSQRWGPPATASEQESREQKLFSVTISSFLHNPRLEKRETRSGFPAGAETRGLLLAHSHRINANEAIHNKLSQSSIQAPPSPWVHIQLRMHTFSAAEP
jgi:hypothetical protein